jgi:Arc/MetJ-type ribon-helix-helix transcriptional regulator
MEKCMKNKQRFGLSVSFSDEEQKMVEALRKPPYYINMSEFIRECIRRLYEEKIKG